ncbi:MAG: hypothetical protein CTY34_08090 [Methylobacter sp.]|nr:MAG: hypothetical protein CTY34_08090 [Methylobacter sp.]PPD03144.1 MAG: hypothetical protein CTY29_10500 [Methylobacter sp.]
MTAADCDVFIAGCGPAGAATAIALAAVAPKLRVCLADAGADGGFRVGESVPPLLQRFMEHLGLWPSFLAQAHQPSFRTISAWGSERMESAEFFLQVHNTGWRLDRARFDRWLASQAWQGGASGLTGKVRALTKAGENWRIDCGAAGVLTGRCVVDATGRSAALSRFAGLKPVNHDRLTACVGFFEASINKQHPAADAAVVETFREGWWYTAATPSGQRVVALMADSDWLRQSGAARLNVWRNYLTATDHVHALTDTDRLLAPLKVWPSSSRCLNDTLPAGLLAVGDAASSFDPLSSQGIIKALRSGIFASYALADYLVKGDGGQGLTRYAALIHREFNAYLNTLRNYYLLEQRWPDSPFWQRRHTINPVHPE